MWIFGNDGIPLHWKSWRAGYCNPEIDKLIEQQSREDDPERCKQVLVNRAQASGYDVAGDRATGRATTVVSIATSSGYKIMGQGAYHDDLVTVNREWKIRHRRVVNDYLVSDPTKS